MAVCHGSMEPYEQAIDFTSLISPLNKLSYLCSVSEWFFFFSKVET